MEQSNQISKRAVDIGLYAYRRFYARLVRDFLKTKSTGARGESNFAAVSGLEKPKTARRHKDR